MVATSSLTDHGTNANDMLGAETLMMVKERIAEKYGPIRYTMGDGCSGGSIMQLNIAAAYPGLLDGIQPNCTYPDTFTTAIEVMECGLLGARYYLTPNGSALTTAQRNAIDGHAARASARRGTDRSCRRSTRRTRQLRLGLAGGAHVRQAAPAAGGPLHGGDHDAAMREDDRPDGITRGNSTSRTPASRTG